MGPIDSGQAPETLVLVSGTNASFAYFVEPHLLMQGVVFQVVDVTQVGAEKIDWEKYERVIIVRYVPSELVKPLSRFHAAGRHVIYFMDDDLMDYSIIKTLPTAYARKIRKNATGRRDFIRQISTECWVSTTYLAEKYRSWSPTVLSPCVKPALLIQSANTTVCYHGTSSHRAELQWLTDVVAGAHARCSRLNFEVFGDHVTNKLFKSLPRVAVLHPMSWNNYLEYTASVRREIGLAPLLPSPFNDARAPTKFLDFARMGAVGLYSNVAPYRGFIRDGIDGLLLDNDPALWMETITALAEDGPRRERMAAAARERAFGLIEGLSEDGPRIR